MTKLTGRPTLGDSLASVRALATELGWARTLRIGLSISTPSAVDALFADLPAGSDDREQASREQAGPAILLYRALRSELGQKEALRITGLVVRTGALRFLGRQLHDLDPAAFVEMSEKAREEVAKRWLAAFFTAESRLDSIGEDEVVFSVMNCALHRLAVATGHPELAPLFCEADAAFFASRTPPVLLERPTMLARGDASCLFQLRMSALRR